MSYHKFDLIADHGIDGDYLGKKPVTCRDHYSKY